MASTSGGQPVLAKREKLKRIFNRKKTPEPTAALVNPPTLTSQAVKEPPKSLWNSAFEELRIEEAELITQYEVLSGTALPDTTSGSTGSQRIAKNDTDKDNLDRMIELGQQRAKKQFRIAGYNVQEGLAKTAETVDWAKEWIDQAVQASPQASLAWSVISLGIPFLTYPAAAEKDCKEGFTYTLSRMQYYVALEADIVELGNQMKPIVVDFYKTVLAYQIRSVLRFHRRTIANVARDVFQLEDWKGMLQELTTKEQYLSQSVLQSSSINMSNHLKELASSAVTFETRLKNMIGLAEEQLAVIKRIQNTTSMSADYQQKSFEHVLDRQEMECLQLFRLSDASGEDNSYEAFKDRNACRVEGTCLWFLNQPHYKEWLGQDSGPLFVTADPGCGKSVLATYLIDEVLPQPVYYFFFKDQVQNRQTQALCALIHQILSKHHGLITLAMPFYHKNSNGLVTNVTLLWDLLSELIDHHGPLTIVLDALDECSESDRTGLLNKLRRYLSKTKAKFLLTSRPYGQVTGELHELVDQYPHIRIFGEDLSDEISPEINLVIDARVDQLATKMKLTDEIKTQILQRLLRVPHRTYLWVYLVLEYLGKGFRRTPSGVEEHIKQLPTTVTLAYEQILGKGVAPNETSMARSILNILLAARRTLSPSELQVALTIASHPNAKSLKDIELEDREDFILTLRRTCGLLVVVQDDKVYFLHQTVREFLIGALHTTGWHGSFQISTANELLTSVCLDHLLLDNLAEQIDLNLNTKRDGQNHLGSGSLTSGLVDPHKMRLLLYPLVRFTTYALKEWPEHYREVQDFAFTTYLNEKALKTCGLMQRFLAIRHLRQFGLIYDNPDRLLGASDLLVATHYGFAQLLPLGFGFTDVNAQSDTGWTALHEAVRQDDEHIVRLLIANGAQVDIVGDEEADELLQTTAVHLMFRSRNPNVFELIAERSHDIDAKDSYGMTPLHWVLLPGNHDPQKLAHCLLKANASVHSKDKPGQTPLHLAAQNRSLSVVQLLLDHGADPRAVDEVGQTTLHFASQNSNLDVLEYLLTVGLDVEQQSVSGQRPLHLAAKSRKHIEVLLKAGADAGAQDEQGKAPLHYAVQSGDIDGISKLCEPSYQVHINTKDRQGQTPLFHLPRRIGSNPGSPAIIATILYAAGAHMNVQDDNGWTVFHILLHHILSDYFFFIGRMLDQYDEFVSTLTSSGSNINTVDSMGRSPLAMLLADANSRLGTRRLLNFAKILVQCGADTSICDLDGRTALHMLVLNKNFHPSQPEGLFGKQRNRGISGDPMEDTMVLLSCLVSSGTNHEIKDRQGMTALDYARERDFDEQFLQRMERALQDSKIRDQG